jgi:large repetitive protein
VSPTALRLALSSILSTISLVALAATLGGCEEHPTNVGNDTGDNPIVTGDADGDGYRSDIDCNDELFSVHPGADELCDGVDNDCDGLVDDDAVDASTWYLDADGDHFGDASRPTVSCSQPEGNVPDETDCADDSAAVNPRADELCNGIDDDCDGLVDDGDADVLATHAFFSDADGDGYGVESETVVACEAPPGYATMSGDCNDYDPSFYPGATETDCTDPNDYNCDGSVDFADDDADGFAACLECDDDDPAVFPGAAETCDGRDNDCDGLVDAVDPDALGLATWYADSDADGYGNVAVSVEDCSAPSGFVSDGTDCDDTLANAHPGAPEICDAIDNDCDGTIDDGVLLVFYLDGDGDGWGIDTTIVEACTVPEGYAAESGDCDDTDARFHPDASESDCTDPNDYNCDGSVDYADADSDGYAACADCDDTNSAAFPGATELCDGFDDNCDGTIDEDDAIDALTWYRDADGDTFGNESVSYRACHAPEGYVSDDDDCDDTSASSNPAASEVCDDADNNCDGFVDEDSAVDASTWYRDADGDGFGIGTLLVRSCDVPSGYVDNPDDCDDTVASNNPAASEVCDDADNNCNGVVDEDSAIDAPTWYQDADGDSFGNGTATYRACQAPTGYVSDQNDCDDAVAANNPAASEVCDDADNNCDGVVDEDSAIDAPTWYQDADGDSFGNGTVAYRACQAPTGYVSDQNDCDDAVASNNPAASEVCDDVDNNCDGTIDESAAIDALTWYRDGDGDGFGLPTMLVLACDQPVGYVEDDDDCDDSTFAVNPAAIELCDSTDNNCDGIVDEDSAADALTWYLDADGDGFGDPTLTYRACHQPEGYDANDDDCNDSAYGINPAASERCDDVDNDCDGTVDEDGAVDASTWYRDVDGDGYGNEASTLTTCDAPEGYVTEDGDCDDDDDAINPEGTEVDDNEDNDCDDIVDEGFRAAGDLVISEIMYNPAGTEPNTEWIEIYNPDTENDFYADGLAIYAGSTFYVGTSGLVVPAGGYAVVCYGSSTLGSLCDYVYGSDVNGPSAAGATFNSAFALGNMGWITVRLSLGGTTLDEVQYQASGGGMMGWPRSTNGKSIELSHWRMTASENGTASYWCLATSTFYVSSYTDYGTPAAVNSCASGAP